MHGWTVYRKGGIKMENDEIDMKKITNEILLESFEDALFLKHVKKTKIDEILLIRMRNEIARRLSYWEPHLD